MTGGKGRICLAMLILALVFGVLWYLLAQGKSRPECGGRSYTGVSILEISYSIGIGLGAVFFFNHFGRRKLTQDPTPMEVEMRTYEDSVDTTIIEQQERKGRETG